MLSGNIARIVMRYLVGSILGFLVARQWLSSEGMQELLTDPDLMELVQFGVTLLGGAVTEVCYYYAKKWKWTT